MQSNWPRKASSDQVAEGNLVTTRKAITGTQTGGLLSSAPSKPPVAIDLIDIFRVRDGQLVEHRGIDTLPSVMSQLAQG